jgi:Flp pilus assembly protein TadD
MPHSPLLRSLPPPFGALTLVALSLVAAARPATGLEGSDRLAARGWTVTGGAAPGYVDDRACELCHAGIYDSYQDVAMSKAFYPPAEDRIIEALDRTFHHEPSGRYYEMSFADGGYRFRRYQLDAAGEQINLLEQDVDWILGSGNHSRTYLFKTPGGELFQLPLAWYTQTDSWGMAPGYDSPFHLGVQRMVRRECMFCHNAFPDVAVGSDVFGAPHRFPDELPSGLGCQRCHGPGALHTEIALSGNIGLAPAAIVNPGKLDPRRRDDVCYGCHLQPSVALAGVRRFGRADYSFRPGQALADYKVQIDVVEEGLERGERFEINHHPYRLEQSRCFTESAGKLGCLTCHDPHRKVPAAERASWYRARCLGCHELAETTAHATTEPEDCVSCHMPERRTQDVVRVTMTDHRIQRGPLGPELTAPLAERKPIITDAMSLYPDRQPAGHLAETYRAATVIRADGGANAEAVARLEQLLAASPLPQLEPWLNLAKGQLAHGQPAAFEATARAIFERAPDHPLALEWLGLARAREGRTDEAIALLRRAAASDLPRAESHFNLGVLLTGAGRYAEALAALGRALEIRPTLSSAWFYLGKANTGLDRLQEASAAYRRTLAIDPSLDRAYVAVGDTLLALGRRTAALRYLRHGTQAARDPRAVAEALRRALDEEE